MNRTVSISSLLIFGLIFTFGVFAFYILTAERTAKKAKEIEHIISKTYDEYKLCEQYALVADKAGWYPCLRCSETDSIYLNKGEIWKYGKTCNTEFGRYPNGLPYPYLKYVIEFEGNEQECLIIEKEKIYNYPSLPECLNRKIRLIRPPGNKIDR